MSYASYTQGAPYAENNLEASEFPIITRKVTILSGETLTKGDVLGELTSSGKYIKSLAAASDGSENVSAVLMEDVDASAGDAEGFVILHGHLQEEKLSFGAGHTADSARSAFRLLGIFY